MQMTNDDDMIVKINDNEGVLELEWGVAWKAWQEFFDDEDVKGLVNKFQELIARGVKGKGKGKVGPTVH